MQSQTKLDALARVLREIAESEAHDPKLEARVGDDEAYEDWGRGVGAVHLVGHLTPFGGQVLEVCVKYAGSYRPHPAMDALPGIPAHYLCNGGPDGTYEHLRDKSPTPAFWKKIDRVIRDVNRARSPRMRFYLKQVSKSATGFRGVQTAAHAAVAFSRAAHSGAVDADKQPAARAGVIRLSRDPK
jgi:hypothetical protein